MIRDSKIEDMASFIEDNLCPVCTNRPCSVNIHMEGPNNNKVPVCVDCFKIVNLTYEECPGCNVLVDPDDCDMFEGDIYSDLYGAYYCTECSLERQPD